jgi:hypothetical protein
MIESINRHSIWYLTTFRIQQQIFSFFQFCTMFSFFYLTSDLLSVRSLKLILPKKIASGYYCKPCEFWLSLKNTFSITYPNPTPKV